MKLILGLTAATATLGVSALTTAPRPGGELLAVFDGGLSEAELASRARATGLPVISVKSDERHIILRDLTGDASRRLYDQGAKLVVDARLAYFCGTTTSSTR